MSKILAVDDSLVALEVLKNYLVTIGGHEVDLAFSGSEAERRLVVAKKKYDVLVFDYMMFDISGLDLLHWCREEGITTPVIIISAIDPDTLMDVYDRCVINGLGPMATLTKIPSNPSAILELIVKLTTKK